MTSSVTLSLRVPLELKDQLERVAADEQATMSAVAVGFLQAGLGGAVSRGDGPLVEAVTALYADLEGGQVLAEREMALALARTVQAGGTAGVAAVRELRGLLHALGMDDDEWIRDLAIPD